MNTDQGNQFTSVVFTGLLRGMASRSAWTARAARGTISSLSRLWRTIKYAEVYLKSDDSVTQDKVLIGHNLNFYNSPRPHSPLDQQTPSQVYFNVLPLLQAA